MPVNKRKYRSGKVAWFYQFDLPGSGREHRRLIKKSGFVTKGEAIRAEAQRRIEEQKKSDLEKSTAGVVAPVPTTLAMLLDEFLSQHAQEKLAPKTVERYREQAKYLDEQLLAMPLVEIKPLHLNREWDRLLKA